MSASQQNMGARSASTGPGAAGGAIPHTPSAPSTTPSQGSGSNQNLNQIVIDYLSKKGYTQTEATLRREMNNVDSQGRIVHSRAEDHGGHKYVHAYLLLLAWIDENLEIYKHELQRLRWPIFVYSFLNIVTDHFSELAQQFFNDYKQPFEREHDLDIRNLHSVALAHHVTENETAKIYFDNKYRLTLVESTYFSLMSFLESKERQGGSVIIGLMQKHMNIMAVNRISSSDRSFASLLARNGSAPQLPDEDEGIPGHNPGSANTDQNAPSVLTRLSLGRMPMDAERQQDVRDELADLDKAEPPQPGQSSLTEEFEMQIKREESADAPSRESVPYPKALAREVSSDVEKIRAYRDRFKLGPRTGGIGAGVSVCMYTFHNTSDSMTCIDFSGDNEMVAAGFEEHYIRVWTLDGKPLPSANPEDQPVASRRLIGHSAPIYSVSFSPGMSRSVAAEDEQPAQDPDAPSLRPHFLLSASADSTLRLWELTTYNCLVVFKGHTTPVWDARFSPHGHYFLSGGQDKTARLWATNSIAPLRILAGHDSDVDVVAWHPNGAYVFTGSSDHTVRMWDVSSGRAVRLLTGHTGALTALSCAPNGRFVASADDSGALIVWNLETGRRARTLRGHGRGGIWSLDWSVESAVLVSAGMDGTVRAWDMALGDAASPAGNAASADAAAAAAAGKSGDKAAATAAQDGKVTAPPAAGAVTTKRQGLVPGMGAPAGGVSPEQISCFATKKSPVYVVRFTDMNLCLAGGAYLP